MTDLGQDDDKAPTLGDVPRVLIESEKDRWRDAARLGVAGSIIGLLIGAGGGFYYLGVTGFLIGAIGGFVVGGIVLALMYILA